MATSCSRSAHSRLSYTRSATLFKVECSLDGRSSDHPCHPKTVLPARVRGGRIKEIRGGGGSGQDFGAESGTGEATFADKDAREVCNKVGCYDSPNHSNYMKAFGNLTVGAKDTGWKLSNPGLLEAATSAGPALPASGLPDRR